MTKEAKLILQMVRNHFDTCVTYDFSEINWETLIKQLIDHRIYTNAFQVLRKNVPDEYREYVMAQYTSITTCIDEALRLLEKFTQEAQRERIRFVLIKGFSLTRLLCSDLYGRQFNDLDILVEEDDMIRAHHVLRNIGYKQPYVYDKKTRKYKDLKYPVSRVRQAHHWFIYYHMARLPWQKLELHRKINFATMEQMKDHLWNVEKISIGSVSVNVPNIPYSYISLILNTYQDSDTISAYQCKTRLRGYIELYYFLKKYSEAIDWDWMKALIKEYQYVGITNRVLDHLYELYHEDWILRFKLTPTEESIRFWEIPMTFEEYMFDTERRRLLIRNAIKADVFSREKPRLPIYSEPNYSAMWKLETIHPVDIRYQVTYSEESLKLHILLDSRIVSDIENYMFQFIIYNNVANSRYLYTLLELSCDYDLRAILVNSPYRQVSGIVRHTQPQVDLDCTSTPIDDKLLLVSEIKFSDMGLEERDIQRELAIEFNWFKQMHPQTFNIMEDKLESQHNPSVVHFA